MKIITGNNALRQCIPNTMATVPGEASWYDKLFPNLAEAERWLEVNITGSQFLEAMEKKSDSDQLKQICAKIIVAHALMGGIPSLDLVLTPNGFGIVNTQNIAPASKDRIERLIASMEEQRDNAIDTLLVHLPAQQGWQATEQGEYFASTLFPRLTICNKLAIKDARWVKYQELHERLVKIENVLAETYFSPQLMEAFRQKVIMQQAHDGIVADVIRRIQSLEMMLLSDIQVHVQSYYDIVQVIRENETAFPEWHQSKTAELYKPANFVNTKESKGYWF